MCPVKESNLESSLLPDLYYMLGRLDIRDYVKQSERLSFLIKQNILLKQFERVPGGYCYLLPGWLSEDAF